MKSWGGQLASSCQQKKEAPEPLNNDNKQRQTNFEWRQDAITRKQSVAISKVAHVL
jgi:hypothetical protein